MRLFIVYTALVLLFVSCRSEKVFDIDEEKISVITFNHLPVEVQSYIEHNIGIIDSGKLTAISLDKGIEFTYGKSGRSNNWFNEVNSNYNHFFIDGVHYRLGGNRGKPFILYEGEIYFFDLNIYQDDFKEQSFF